MGAIKQESFMVSLLEEKKIPMHTHISNGMLKNYTSISGAEAINIF